MNSKQGNIEQGSEHQAKTKIAQGTQSEDMDHTNTKGDDTNHTNTPVLI